MKQEALEIYSDRQSQPRQGPMRSIPQAPPITPTKATFVAELEELRVTRHVLASSKPDVGALNVDLERAIANVLDGRPALGETIDAAFRRKEYELGTVFARLSVIQAHMLLKRFSNPRAGDELAAKFGTMIAIRRSRLLAFLGDARRREALAGGRK